MFVSTDFLAIHYGIDNAIAKFFVDREPPANNLYWHEKLLYLRPAPGYLFIPLMVDLLYKMGVEKEQLLSEPFVSHMEKIGHINALEETKQITAKEATGQYAELASLNGKNPLWLFEVSKYFEGISSSEIGKLATPFKALHRGDAFLFSIAALSFPLTLMVPIAEVWFALISTLLLLDDADDLLSDKKTGEENAFIESGLTAAGFSTLQQMVQHNLTIIGGLNKTMAAELNKCHQRMVALPQIVQLIKSH